MRLSASSCTGSSSEAFSCVWGERERERERERQREGREKQRQGERKRGRERHASRSGEVVINRSQSVGKTRGRDPPALDSEQKRERERPTDTEDSAAEESAAEESKGERE